MTIAPFRFTREEAWEAIRAQLRSRKRSIWVRSFPYSVIAVGFLLFTGSVPELPWLAPALLMLVGLILLIGPIWHGYSSADRWMAGQSQALPAEHLIEEEALTRKTAEICIQCQWAGLARFEETRRLFLLYVTADRAGFIIPKRAFQSEVDIENARRIFRQRIRRDPPSGFPVGQAP